MDTNTAQPTPQDSYADAYVPPSPMDPQNQQSDPQNQPQDQTQDAQNQPVNNPPMDPPSSDQTYQPPQADTADQPVEQTQPVEPTQPEPSPVVEPTQSVEPTTEPTTPSETLADQNIFEMLGVTTGTTEQREQFLDELQQVIWEDFLEHDTKLLLTEAEQAELDKILQSSEDKSLEQQEQVVVYLEKLIPDLEDIMLEKALQLKEEMARERLNALRELHRNEPDKMASIQQADQQMAQSHWRTAAEILNALG